MLRVTSLAGIHPRLWLGTLASAQQLPDGHCITDLVDLTGATNVDTGARPRHVCPVSDNRRRRVTQAEVGRALDKLTELLADRHVMLYCHAGEKRSPAIAALYAVVRRRMDPLTVAEYIDQQKKRIDVAWVTKPFQLP